MHREETLDLAWQQKDTAWVWEYVVIYDLIKADSKILDVGCGDGVLSSRLKAAKNCNATGIDMSPEAIRKAKLNGIEAIIGDIEKPFDFADESFDYVILCNILEHLVDPLVTLKESLRVARKQVIISTPNFAVFPARAELMFGHFPTVPLFGWKWYNSQHIRLFSYNDLRHALKELNFGVHLAKGEFQPFYFTPVLNNRLPNPLSWLCVKALKKFDEYSMNILARLMPNLFALSYVVALEKDKDFSIEKIKKYEYSV